jgi:transposase
LVRHFVAATPARAAAQVVGVNRHTATLFFHRLREVIAVNLSRSSPELLAGEVELDESYFGGHRKGKRGRGAAGKVPVFGLLKRGGKVHAVMITNASRDTLLPIIKQRVKPDSIVYTDSFSAYDVLDVTGFRHQRINHRERFVDSRSHINGIENFWNQAKRYLRRYNGVPKANFHLYLKECEWRFNYRPAAKALAVLQMWLAQSPIAGQSVPAGQTGGRPAPDS